MPQRGNKGFQLTLDIGERNCVGVLLKRAERTRILQCEKFQPPFGVILGGANAAERPALERTKIKTVEHARGTVKQKADDSGAVSAMRPTTRSHSEKACGVPKPARGMRRCNE